DAVDANADTLIKITKDLVAFPSIQTQEKFAQAYYAELLRKIDIIPDVWEPEIDKLDDAKDFYQSRPDYSGSPNVVGVFKGSGGGRSIILNGHIDVVPAESGKWSVSPQSGFEKCGRIYGRGAADMKGGLAVSYIAVKSLIDAGIKLKGDVLLESVVDEETGGGGTLATIIKGYIADAAIFTEPTNLMIYPATMGSAWFKINVKGRGAHGAIAYQGVNAIEKSYLIYKALKQLESRRAVKKAHPLYTYMKKPFCINVGKFFSGYWPSIVPDEAIMEGRLGVSPNETLAEARQEFEEAIYNAARKDNWLRNHIPEVEWFGPSWEGSAVDIDSSLVQLLKMQGEKTLNQEVQTIGAPWPADATFMNMYGIPAINFGPGETEQAHQVDESVSIDHLIKCAKIIACTIVSWCGKSEFLYHS
ncbi:MAG: peptidase, partial [Parabacteroides sp.]|nr:peptidase [Parabacteroides sp.]